MPHLYDIAYALGLALASPYWLLVPKARTKVLTALRERRSLSPDSAHPSPQHPPPPTVLIHAVSLGEINATRTLVTELLARRPDARVVVSATTATGYARALELYSPLAPRVIVARYPLDFTSAVERFLSHYRPDVVVLMELELWPNFLRLCRQRDIPVVLVNGRLTLHSLRRYRLIAPIARGMFRSLRLLCVQDATYRDRFLSLGVDPAHIEVTGTMKFDTAVLATDPAKVAALASALGLTPTDRVWVCGSTGPGEEAICLGVYRELLQHHPDLRLVLVPRKPERFDEVAELIRSQGFALRRRSSAQPDTADPNPVILGDTMGELRLFYALATVVFVGRSLVDLGPKQHGSDMLEPAALGKPTLTGLFTGNFADAMHLLRQNRAILEVASAEQLADELRRLLSAPTAAEQLASAARTTITQGQGATSRHADHLLRLLPQPKV